MDIFVYNYRYFVFFFFSSRRRHTRWNCDWSSDVCSSDLSVPLGLNEELAELGEVGLKSGIRNIGGSIATASGLVFIGATVDHKFRAFDAKTGKELWVADLQANGNATPITFMGKDGAQYVVIPAAGGGPAARG